MKILFVTLFLPLGLVLLSLGGALWVAVRKRVYGAVLFWLSLALAVGYVFSTPIFARALSLGLIQAVKARELGNPSGADVIVVLTGGMYNAGAVGWLPKPESIQRLAVAYELQRSVNIRLPVIVSGGHTEGIQVPSEAAVVANYFAKMRTEITPTELEEASTDTYESAAQLAPVLAHREAKNILLVTSDVHMLRSLAVFRAKGMDPIPFPALISSASMGFRDILPSVDGLKATTTAVYEYYGLAAYLLAGKISWGDVFYKPIVIKDLPPQIPPSLGKAGEILPPPGVQIPDPVGEVSSAGVVIEQGD